MTAQLESPDGAPITGAALNLANGGVPFDATATTGADGTARLILYDYELHDGADTSGKILTRKLAPHTLQVTDGTVLLATKPDGATNAWDITGNSGTHTPALFLNGIRDGRKLTLSY